jgi:hypothetical protein
LDIGNNLKSYGTFQQTWKTRGRWRENNCQQTVQVALDRRQT